MGAFILFGIILILAGLLILLPISDEYNLLIKVYRMDPEEWAEARKGVSLFFYTHRSHFTISASINKSTCIFWNRVNCRS